MTAASATKWRMAWRGIAASLAMIAVLTAIMWACAPYFARYHISDYLGEIHPDDVAWFVPSFRKQTLLLAAIFGGVMAVYWLIAAKWGGDTIRNPVASWLLGAAWVLILVLYADAGFSFGPQLLEFTCPTIYLEPGLTQMYSGPEPCEEAWAVRAALLFLLPLLLIALSALLRILLSRRKDAAIS